MDRWLDTKTGTTPNFCVSIRPCAELLVTGNTAQAASTSELSRFGTELPSFNENLAALIDLVGAWIDSVQECAPLGELIPDMDSSEKGRVQERRCRPSAARATTSAR